MFIKKGLLQQIRKMWPMNWSWKDLKIIPSPSSKHVLVVPMVKSCTEYLITFFLFSFYCPFGWVAFSHTWSYSKEGDGLSGYSPSSHHFHSITTSNVRGLSQYPRVNQYLMLKPITLLPLTIGFTTVTIWQLLVAFVWYKTWFGGIFHHYIAENFGFEKQNLFGPCSVLIFNIISPSAVVHQKQSIII